jgi:ABC-2 type transport system ATP-binding protein
VRLATGELDVDEHARQLVAPVSGGSAALLEAVRAFDEVGIEILDIGLRRPTLDDVFLQLTGHHAESGPADGDPMEANTSSTTGDPR